MALARLVDNNVISEPRQELVSAALATLWRHLRDPSREVRWLAIVGWVLVLSGLAHVVVWLVDGRPPLEGATGWRKPIVFGLSTGVTTLSLAALRVGAPQKLRWSLTYLVTMVLELALIDLQAWRGVGSHFNISTLFDGAVFGLMGLTILVSMAAAVVLGVSAARAKQDADLELSTQLATAALVLGSLIGIAIAVHGSVVQQLGGTPGYLGAGEWKPVHAIALHGLQLFPLVAWWLRRTVPLTSSRVRLLSQVAGAWGLLVAASFVQLLLHRAPADLSMVTVLLLAASGALGLATVVHVLRSSGPGVAR